MGNRLLEKSAPKHAAVKGLSSNANIGMLQVVLLNEAWHAEVSTHWIPRFARNDIFAFVMLSEAKHPCTGFLAGVRDDSAFVLLNEARHAEASTHWIPRFARNDRKECVQ